MSVINDKSPASVGLIASGEIFGGAERQIIFLVRNISGDCRLSVGLFHDGELAARLRSLGHSPIILAKGLAGAVQIRRLLQVKNIRLVHVHGYRAAIETALATVGIPAYIVKTVHGAPELDQPTLSARIRARAFHVMEKMADRLGRTYSVFVTRELRDRCAQNGPRSEVIYNGLEINVAKRGSRPVEYRSGCRNVLVLARLEYVKGVDIAVRAFAMLRTPDTNMVVVGDGPEARNLKALVQDLGMDSRVFFSGFQSDVSPYLSHADILLMPSRHEGLPYALLEAMMYRVPIVATMTGGMKEVLADGATALLAPPECAEELAYCMDTLLSDRQLQGQLTAAAANLLNRDFSAQLMAKRYVDLYRRLLSSERLR